MNPISRIRDCVRAHSESPAVSGKPTTSASIPDTVVAHVEHAEANLKEILGELKTYIGSSQAGLLKSAETEIKAAVKAIIAVTEEVSKYRNMANGLAVSPVDDNGALHARLSLQSHTVIGKCSAAVAELGKVRTFVEDNKLDVTSRRDGARKADRLKMTIEGVLMLAAAAVIILAILSVAPPLAAGVIGMAGLAFALLGPGRDVFPTSRSAVNRFMDASPAFQAALQTLSSKLQSFARNEAEPAWAVLQTTMNNAATATSQKIEDQFDKDVLRQNAQPVHVYHINGQKFAERDPANPEANELLLETTRSALTSVTPDENVRNAIMILFSQTPFNAMTDAIGIFCGAPGEGKNYFQNEEDTLTVDIRDTEGNGKWCGGTITLKKQPKHEIDADGGIADAEKQPCITAIAKYQILEGGEIFITSLKLSDERIDSTKIGEFNAVSLAADPVAVNENPETFGIYSALYPALV